MLIFLTSPRAQPPGLLGGSFLCRSSYHSRSSKHHSQGKVFLQSVRLSSSYLHLIRINAIKLLVRKDIWERGLPTAFSSSLRFMPLVDLRLSEKLCLVES